MSARSPLSNPRNARRRAQPAAEATSEDLQRVLAEAKEASRIARAALTELRRVAKAQVRQAESWAALVQALSRTGGRCRCQCDVFGMTKLVPREKPPPGAITLTFPPLPWWRRLLRALFWRS